MIRVQQKGSGGRARRLLWLNVLVCSALAWSGFGVAPAEAQNQGGPGDDQRTEWFRQSKFGMFVHWGIYSVPAGEWKEGKNHAEWIMLTGSIPSTEYEKFAPQFNPVQFDARQWVQLAKDAGMKYLVITSKHHDGFCMYDSKLTDYDIMQATPFGRDPMKELAAACQQAGLKFCFYYSVVDWHHPEFPAQYSQRGFHGDPNPKADLNKYVEYMKGQVSELLSNYGPIGIMWFDGGGSFRGQPMAQLIHAQEIIELIHKLQPMCLVNNRLGLPADYGTPEQRIPGQAPKDLFEVCMTLNRHWGYNKYDQDWKSPETIIRNLADIAGKGGNYLLNVGPTALGTIPEGSVRTLRAVGQWMKVNGESIYGTTASPFARTPWGRCTAKAGKLYLHVFDWPSDGKLVVPGLKNMVTKAYLLAAADTRCSVTQGNGQVTVAVPREMPDPIDTVMVLEIQGDAAHG
jgi:alpha-L-fucosidase